MSNEIIRKLGNNQILIQRYKLIFSEAFYLSLKKFRIKLFEAVQYFDPKFIQSSVRRRDKIIPEFLYPSDHLITEWEFTVD